MKLAIRVDDPPSSDEIEEIENMGEVARKYKCPLTLAIPSGWLDELEDLHERYREYYRKGLISLGCHGYYHEDFTGLGSEANKAFKGLKRLGKPLIVKGVDLKEAGQVLEKCQDFARSFFRKNYTLFVPPSRVIFPLFSDKFHQLLMKYGFTAISSLGGMDPMVGAFERVRGLFEIPFTIYVDFWRRRGASGVDYTPEKIDWYLEATKDHVRTRFRYGLYVCIMLHAINFDEKPTPEVGFSGDNPGGLFLDKLLGWVTTEYPKVKFVSLEELAPKGSPVESRKTHRQG